MVKTEWIYCPVCGNQIHIAHLSFCELMSAFDEISKHGWKTYCDFADFIKFLIFQQKMIKLII